MSFGVVPDAMSAWNPLTAPQLTVMKISGHAGNCLGCKLPNVNEGIGIPPEIPSWGNIMAEGRTLFRVFPHNILYPGIFLALTVLAINIMGDGLRDTLDPKMSKKV